MSRVSRRASIAGGRLHRTLRPSPNVTLWTATHDASQVGGSSGYPENGGLTMLPEWYSPSTGKSGDYGGGEYNSGGGLAEASTDHARSGSWSAKLIANGPFPPSSGTRLFRWRELRSNRHLIMEAFFYFPEAFRLTHDPADGKYMDLFQFKSTDEVTLRNDPFWYVVPAQDGTDEWAHKFIVSWGYQGAQEGPRAGEFGWQNFEPGAKISVPIGEWFGLRAYIKQSNAFDGRVIFWYLPPGGGAEQLITDQNNVRTGYTSSRYGNAWSVDQGWSINNYTDGVDPDPYELYVDDASISTVIFGAVRAPDAPRIRSASPLNGSARIVVQAPDYDGGAAVDGYRAVASPGGASITGAGPRLDVPGLSNGVAYTFSVTAHNSEGYGDAATTDPVTPAVPPFDPISATGSRSAQTTTPGTAHAITKPAGAATGDVCEVAIVIGPGSGGTPVDTTITGTPTGWTLVSGPTNLGSSADGKLYRYRRTLAGTADDDFACTTGLSCRAVLLARSYTNVDTQDVAAQTGGGSGDDAGTLPTITTVTDTAWAVAVYATLTGSGTITAPVGMVEAITSVFSGGYRLSIFEDGPVSPADDYGPTSAQFNAPRQWAGSIDALRPTPI